MQRPHSDITLLLSWCSMLKLRIEDIILGTNKMSNDSRGPGPRIVSADGRCRAFFLNRHHQVVDLPDTILPTTPYNPVFRLSNHG